MGSCWRTKRDSTKSVLDFFVDIKSAVPRIVRKLHQRVKGGVVLGVVSTSKGRSIKSVCEVVQKPGAKTYNDERVDTCVKHI